MRARPAARLRPSAPQMYELAKRPLLACSRQRSTISLALQLSLHTSHNLLLLRVGAQVEDQAVEEALRRHSRLRRHHDHWSSSCFWLCFWLNATRHAFEQKESSPSATGCHTATHWIGVCRYTRPLSAWRGLVLQKWVGKVSMCVWSLVLLGGVWGPIVKWRT